MRPLSILKEKRWWPGLIIATILVVAVVPLLTVFAAEVTIDDSVSSTGNVFDGTAPDTVFISDQVGYKFYPDSTLRCVYKKTTDGGSTWGSEVTLTDSGTNCYHVAVWYDRWTPGNTTGTYIEMVFTQVLSTSEDLTYNRLDTSNDALLTSSPTNFTTGKTNDFRGDDNYASIGKGTNGAIYAGVMDSGTAGDQSYIMRCAATCSTAGNWSDSGIVLPEDAQARNNPLAILPQANNDMMAIIADGTLNAVESKKYTAATSTWDANWTVIDSNAPAHTGYAGENISAIVDPSNFTIYLTYTADSSTGGTNDDIRSATYSGGSWASKTDILTNEVNRATISVNTALNTNNGDIYVFYLLLTNPADMNTGKAFWKRSTDGMNTWGTEQGPVNSSINNRLDGVHVNPISDQRLFGSWTEAATETTSPRLLKGDTIADIGTTYNQIAYRLFNNSNSTNVGTPLAAQDSAATLANAGDAFRLRTLLRLGGDSARINHKDFKLQFVDRGTGTCTAPSGGTPATYTDVTASTSIAFNDNATPSDGAALTANANDPVDSGHTTRNQTYKESNNFTNSIAAIATSEDGMWDFSLRDNNAPGKTFCFRVVQADGTVLNTYTQYPQVTTAIPNTPPNNPAGLKQRKTDNMELPAAAWTNNTTIRFTVTASDPDASDTLQLCVEKELIGTPLDGSGEVCGGGVAYSGTPVNVSVDIGSQSEGQYHWQARVKDAAGIASSWVRYSTATRGIAHQWSGDGLTDGTVVTTSTAGPGDTPFNSVNGTGGNVLVSATGNRPTRLQFPALANQSKFLSWTNATLGSHTTYAVRTYVQLTSYGNVSSTFFRLQNGGTDIWRVDVAGTGGAPPGEVRLRGTGGVLLDDSGTLGLATNTVYRIEGIVNNGTVTVNIYEGDSTVLWDSLTGTVGTTVNGLDVGPSGLTTVPLQYIDEVAFSAQASAIGPTRDYGIDTTPPSGGTVYDGSTAGVDAAFNDGSLSALSGNWNGFSDTASGVASYEYSMGSTPGGTDIKGWTNNTNQISVTASSLTLRTTQPYYVNVRATDNAGNTGSVVSSDGQLVLPSLSFGTSGNSITFDNLNAANSYTNTKSTTLTTSTNAYGGYVIRAFATTNDLQSNVGTIPAFAGGSYVFPDAWQSGEVGFGYTSSDTNVQGVNKFQADPCPGGSAYQAPGCFAPFTQTKPGDIVADHTTNVTGAPIVNEQFTITYRVTVNPSQPARNYTTNVVYSVTPQY